MLKDQDLELQVNGEVGDDISGQESSEQTALSLANQIDELYLRQSALSVLVDATALCGWSAGPYLFDVVDIAEGVLTFERTSGQEDRAMRR